VKNLHLLIYSRNYTLAESVKKMLEETGRYRIHVEKRQIEYCTAMADSNLLPFAPSEEKEYQQKVSPIKKLMFFGEFMLDINCRTLYWEKQHLFHLSYREAKILAELLENTGHIVTRKFLLYNYWGEVSYYKSRSLDVLISKLRKYLRLDPSIEIVNYRSEGLQIVY
jgi:DNA-binding response OmpR family regulator